MQLNLDFLLETPDFSAQSALIIEPLAPLSMVSGMPGKYYRSQSEPTDMMLYGMIENSLGWHIGEKERKELKKRMEKAHKGVNLSGSGVGYVSLLQYHLKLTLIAKPKVLHYDDLWAQHLKGASFIGGSRNYSYEAIPVMNAVRGGKVIVNDTAKANKDPEALTGFKDGETVHVNVVRPYFPQYYASPTPRENVIAEGLYAYHIETSPYLLKLIREAIESPAAPLYLGSNDGWVELSLEDVNE